MQATVGGADRIVRVVIGLALLSLLLILEGNARWWGLVGFIPLGTALMGWCPLYVPLGIKTCRTRQ
jgi:hypothetical protein